MSFDYFQAADRTARTRIRSVAMEQLDNQMTLIDDRFAAPFDVTLSGDVITIGASTIQTLESDGADGTQNSFKLRIPAISNQDVATTISTLNLTTGETTGSFANASDPGMSNTSGYYVQMGIECRSDGKLYIIWGSEAATLEATTLPSFTTGSFPILVAKLQNNGTAGAWHYVTPAKSTIELIKGAAGGGGTGLQKITLWDAFSTTQSTGAPVTIDGVTVTNGMTVLFTALSSGNNKVYKATVSGGNVTAWTAQQLFDGSDTPTDGDTAIILQGTLLADTILGFTGTEWTRLAGNYYVRNVDDSVTGQTGTTITFVRTYQANRGATFYRNGQKMVKVATFSTDVDLAAREYQEVDDGNASNQITLNSLAPAESDDQFDMFQPQNVASPTTLAEKTVTSARGFADGTNTQNCSISTVSNKTRVALSGITYAVGMNSGKVFGDLRVLVNGQLIERKITGLNDVDGMVVYDEVNDSTIDVYKYVSGSPAPLASDSLINVERDINVGSNVEAINSPIIPGADNTYDLGSDSKRWRHGYFGPDSVFIGDGRIRRNSTTGRLEYSKDGGTSPYGPLGGGSAITVMETPSGTIDGTNTTFTLSYNPIQSVMVILNGLIRVITTDFTVSGKTLTFTFAPAVGSEIVVFYTSDAQLMQYKVADGNGTEYEFANKFGLDQLVFVDGVLSRSGTDVVINPNRLKFIERPGAGQSIYTVAAGFSTFSQGVMSGTVNGTNKDFTLPVAPSSSGAMIVALNGIVQQQGVDYTVSGSTVTFEVAPEVGQVPYAIVA